MDASNTSDVTRNLDRQDGGAISKSSSLDSTYGADKYAGVPATYS